MPRLRSLLVLLALALGTLAVVAPPRAAIPDAGAATPVAKQACRRIDPNLVNGVCLRYPTAHGTALTWIGSYRAPDGRIFFCIDYLYDSRLPARADEVSTERLVNQLGERVGEREVAALNYVVSTWAGGGSTGSDARDAAIALIVREVMGDGTRPGGIEVYPDGLVVGGRVLPPRGGLSGPVVGLARAMWREAGRFAGPYRLRLTTSDIGKVRLGRQRTYRISVLSASGRRVPGVPVTLDCAGPVTCPERVRSKAKPRALTVRPTGLGRFRIRAQALGPSSDGLLYRDRSWHTHGGPTARGAGRQRGWIAHSSRTAAVVRATSVVEKARPEVVTQASHQVARPGALLHDVVRVTGLPTSYDAVVQAELHGPYDVRPGRDDCTAATRVGRVTLPVAGNGTYRTPTIAVAEVGYYTWVERFPGDDATVPVTTRCGIAAETTTVVPFTPEVSTETSTRTAEVDDSVRDTITLDGVEDTAVTLEWRLLGPRQPRGGSCAGLDWSTAATIAEGQIATTGDGTYRTPRTTLTSAGCVTFAVDVPATALSDMATSPPGLPSETTRVDRREPRIATAISSQRSLSGDRIRDKVTIAGLRSSDRVTVRWWLLGPVAPRRGTSCRGLDWASARAKDTGSFEATGNGTHRTPRTTVTTTGCYTYRERIAPTPSTTAAATPPGVPAETTLVTRPVTPYVPEVPTGFTIQVEDVERDRPTRRAAPRYLDRRDAAPTTRTTTDGGRITIPRLDINAPVGPVGLRDGAIAVPRDADRVGWLNTTAHAADTVGASVLSSHVTDRHDRPGALWRLQDARRGDVIRWRDSTGTVHRFVVTRIQRFDRAHGVPGRLFRTTGPHLLHLVTCTARRRADGRITYPANLVVTAKERVHA